MTNGLLQGKTAIVTGAGSGMGKAIAALFTSHGANVVLADLNQEAAEKAAKELGGTQALAIQTDVASHDSVAALVKKQSKLLIGSIFL